MKNLIMTLIAGGALYMVLVGGPEIEGLNRMVVSSHDAGVWANVNDAEEGTAESHVVRHSGKEETRGKIADSRDGAVFLEQILDLPRRSAQGHPTIGAPIDPVDDCTPLVAPGARIYHIYAQESDTKARFALLPGYSVASALKHFMDVWTTKGETAFRPPSWTRMRPDLVHVVVTDMHGPVHLVLHNGGTRLLWGIQQAAGTQISGVTILGGAANGLMHAGPDIPVETINNVALSACGLIAHADHVKTLNSQKQGHLVALEEEAERYEDRWHIDEDGNYVYERSVPVWFKNRHRKDRFETWFEASFGQSFTAEVIGFSKAPVLASLAGPLPVTPIEYRGLEGANVRFDPDAIPLGVSRGDDPDVLYQALILERARKLAGGDLEPLRGIKADF